MYGSSDAPGTLVASLRCAPPGISRLPPPVSHASREATIPSPSLAPTKGRLVRHEDVALQRLALDRLGEFAPPLAREALECGALEVRPDVLEWTGTLGTVRGHHVVLWLREELQTRVLELPAVVDALTAAVATAVANAPGNALVKFEILSSGATAKASPYRGRV